MKEILKKKIVDCDLSVRAINFLEAAGIETVGELCRMHRDEALRIRNIGKKAFTELEDFMEENGLEWGMSVEMENGQGEMGKPKPAPRFKRDYVITVKADLLNTTYWSATVKGDSDKMRDRKDYETVLCMLEDVCGYIRKAMDDGRV